MNQKRKLLSGLLRFLAFFLLSFPAPSQAGKAKPNIIIILADDLGWGDVGYHGSKIKTPVLDRLAKEGLELNRYYVAAVCSPTRAGLMTGRLPDRFGLRTTVIPPWSEFGVDTKEVFLPEVLAQAGYQNRAMLGKWHLGHSSLKYHPLRRGFTHFYGHLNGAIDYFTLEREGERDWHNDYKVSHDKGYATDLLTNEAIKNIKTYNGKSPFFIYLAYNAPHGPLQAKDEDMKQYGFDPAKPRFGNKKEANNKLGRGNTEEMTYAAMVTNMDTNIGRILKTLKDLKIDDNTIVLFHSDNGNDPGNPGASSGGLRGSKFTEWEGGVRAPAIVRWPQGFKGGRKVEQVMGYIDIMPTLLEVAGVKTKPKNEFDGMSVLPFWTGQKKSTDRSFYLGTGAIVSNDWKLVKAGQGNPRIKIQEDHLFRIGQDAAEKVNVREQEAEAYKKLKAQADRYDAIQPALSVPPYEQGRKGFKAPKDWVITE
ncbi:MAG: sulfatase-like hydrolase/transferase [Adhaeribacter sp.]